MLLKNTISTKDMKIIVLMMDNSKQLESWMHYLEPLALTEDPMNPALSIRL